MTPSISLPHSIDDLPLNVRLKLPYLLASVLSLKCHLRERLANAYKLGDREELEALGGAGERSRMSRLRGLVDELHALHRCVLSPSPSLLVLVPVLAR